MTDAESNIPSPEQYRSTRKQKMALVASYYVEKLSPLHAVWSHDVSNWLILSDPQNSIAQPTILVIFNRLEEQGILTPLWEQFDTVVRRPPRKYHQLTEAGTEIAIHNLQELRADVNRPLWVPVPELHDGRYLPNHPEKFSITPPDGTLVPEEK